MDNDGTHTDSKIIISKNTCKTNLFVNSVYYNTSAKDVVVNYTSEENQTVAVNIYDLFGRLVYTERNEMKNGQNNLHIQSGNLSDGIYVCTFSAPNFNVVKKIHVQSE